MTASQFVLQDYSIRCKMSFNLKIPLKFQSMPLKVIVTICNYLD